LQAIFAERFATKTTGYWLGKLDEQDLLCAPILTLAEALAHEQTTINGSVVTIEAGEPIRVLGTPLRMEDGAFRVHRAPPKLGEDGEAVLIDLGYPRERIVELKKTGILA
jgi:formyl-CoA transferase